MSKIQDALGRLKTERPASSLRRQPHNEPTLSREIDQSLDHYEFAETNPQLLAEQGLLPEEAAASVISQQFRHVKRPLLRRMFESYPIVPGNASSIVLVSSATEGEGKTFASFHLALALAIEPELRVVLVDGDTPKQSLTHGFGLSGKPGLLDAAVDRSLPFSSCVYRTSTPDLLFMPSGKRRGDSPELLGSSRMKEILGGISSGVGPSVVVVDSPPLLMANEARSLSTVADHVLLVIRAGTTSVKQVDTAIATLGDTNNLYAILNQSASALSAEYQYGYRYGYGTAAEDSATHGG